MNNEKAYPYELPQGWVWTTLGITSEINPRFQDGLPDDVEVSFIPMKCVEEITGRVDLSLKKRLAEVRKGFTAFKNGDILFAKITPCMENGKVAVVNNLTNGIGFGSTEFHVIRVIDRQMPRSIFFYFLTQEGFRRDAQMHMTGSAGQLRVPVSYIEQALIPLSPLPEQHRIVAKIEELFTRLDAGVEALKKIKTQLRRYRQSVLKHAFEGKLTTEWRRAHQHELEPASVLLERIKQERRNTAGGQYKELPPLDTSTLPELPESWVWARVGEIGLVETGSTPSKSQAAYYGRDYNFYKPTDLNAGYYTRESEDGLSSEGIKKARLLPERSILITCIGATIGKTGFIRQRGASNQQINTIIPDRNMLPEFLYFVCVSPQFQNGILSNASATTLPILSKRKFEVLELPLCSVFEQNQVVEEIERRFSVADQTEKTVDHGLKQADRLRQSILKGAFEGKLVPQDPNDEPAEKLLERIKEERARQQATAKSAKSLKTKRRTKQMRLV